MDLLRVFGGLQVLNEPVVFIDQDHLGINGRVGSLECHDYYAVTLLAQVGRRALDRDDAGTSLAGNGIGLEPVGISDVAYQNLFEVPQTDHIYQLFIDCSSIGMLPA